MKKRAADRPLPQLHPSFLLPEMHFASSPICSKPSPLLPLAVPSPSFVTLRGEKGGGERRGVAWLSPKDG